VRLITPELPGIARLKVLDLPAVDDPSTGRNFTFMHNDLTQPGALQQITHLSSIAGRLNLARDAEAGDARSSIQIVQDPPGTPLTADQPSVRFLVRIWTDADEEPDVDLMLEADNFTELRRRYPRELESYLRPILRELGQDQAIFAVDPRVAWQVLGSDFVPDAKLTAQVNAALDNFNADDFRQREAALQELRRLGQPAALMLARADRSAYSAEQNAGVDAFLAEYLALKPADVERLRRSVEFLTDTLSADDPELRRSAHEQLQEVLGRPVEFDPDASADVRSTQLQKLHAHDKPSSTTQPR
jgi:hypothetical protein